MKKKNQVNEVEVPKASEPVAVYASVDEVETLNAQTIAAIKDSESGKCERYSSLEAYLKVFS